MLKIFKDGFKTMFYNLKKGNVKLEIANLLTLSRLFSPFILIPLIAFNKGIILVIFIVLFSLTDTFDGYFARKYNNITLFGKYLDAFVDKIYFGSLLFPIVLFPWLEKKYLLFIWLILGFELIISILNLYAYYHKLNPYSSYLGKIKTTILLIVIGIVYLHKFIVLPTNIIDYFLILVTILEFITTFTYSIKIKKCL